ncbi:MAG TPA: hypothetical protein PLU24_03070 [Candidatus Omnitrophota bacterium]|nr:hypothetical protein [Candidatus Omnitrophota bacterium]
MRSKLNKYPFFVSVLCFLYAFLVSFIYRFDFVSFTWKMVIVFILMAPVGFFAGIPFSAMLGRSRTKYIAYAIDAAGATIGTVLAFFIHRFLGFNEGFIFAGLAYLLVALFF